MPWWIVENTLLAALLALLVVLVSRARRVPPVVRHGLWLVVLIKLIVPPVFSLGIFVPGEWDLVTQYADKLGQREMYGHDVFEVGGREASFDPPAGTNSLRIGARPPLAESLTVAAFPEQDMNNADSFVPVDEPQFVVLFESADTNRPLLERFDGQPSQSCTAEAGLRPVAPSIAPATFLFWGAVTGTLVALLVQCARIVRIRRLLNRAGCPPVELTHLVVDVAARLSVRPPAVLVSIEIQSPFVCALGRPVLVWPASGLASLRDRARQAIIVHELAHLARRDHWIGWLELAASCGWWWNPLFWYVRHQLHENAELACDAWVTGLFPEARRDYANALVDLAELDSLKTAIVPALGVGDGSRKLFERRLVMIMGDRVRYRMGALGFFGMGLLVLAALPGCSAGLAADEPAPAQSLSGINIDDPALPAVRSEYIPFDESDVRTEPRIEPLTPAVPPANRAQEPAAAPNDERLKRLEDRLESLLSELRELKSSGKNPDPEHDPSAQPGPKQAPALPHTPNPQATAAFKQWAAKPEVPQIETVLKTPLNTRYRKVGDGTVEAVPLTRATYKFPTGRAEEIAAFFKANLTDDIEVRVKGDSLIVTAIPDDQTPIAAFIRLLQTRGTGAAKADAKGPEKRTDPESPKVNWRTKQTDTITDAEAYEKVRASGLLELLVDEQLLLDDYGPEHPKVKAIRKRIELTRTHLKATGDENARPKNEPLSTPTPKRPTGF